MVQVGKPIEEYICCICFGIIRNAVEMPCCQKFIGNDCRLSALAITFKEPRYIFNPIILANILYPQINVGRPKLLQNSILKLERGGVMFFSQKFCPRFNGIVVKSIYLNL